jgi:flagellar basal-body rod protein FlgF
MELARSRIPGGLAARLLYPFTGEPNMDSGYYVAYAGLASRMQALDVAASNLANASTAGFKAQSPFYESLSAAQAGEVLSPLNQAVNRFGILGGSLVDLRSGSLDSTGNNLDLAMEGAGFFSVQTGAGIRYTRNGNFHLNAARQITTQDGNLVLAEQGTTTVPITLPTGTASVSPDGTISVDGGLVATLHIVQFAPGTRIVPEGNSNFAAPAGSETASANSNVREGMLESSNINTVEGAVGLILLQRQADLLGRALSIFSSDFNRAAAQDLPRV